MVDYIFIDLGPPLQDKTLLQFQQKDEEKPELKEIARKTEKGFGPEIPVQVPHPHWFAEF